MSSCLVFRDLAEDAIEPNYVAEIGMQLSYGTAPLRYWPDVVWKDSV
jgi:hypothetical protein